MRRLPASSPPALQSAAACAGDLLLSGGRDASIRVWDLGALCCRRTLAAHGADILHLAARAPGLSANSNAAPFAGAAPEQTGSHGRSRSPSKAAHERDGREENGSARQASNGRTAGYVSGFEGHSEGGSGEVSGLEWSPVDAARLDSCDDAVAKQPAVFTSCSADGTCRLWDMRAWCCLHVFQPQLGAPWHTSLLTAAFRSNRR